MANLFLDLVDYAQRGPAIAFVPLRIEYRAHPPAAIPDIEPDLPIVLGYAAGG